MKPLGLPSNCDLYEILHLEPSADAVDIRRAYRQAALATHPDKGGNSDDFHLVSFAFEVLSCAIMRREYDKKFHDSNLTCQAKKRPVAEEHIQAPRLKRPRYCNKERSTKKDSEQASRVYHALESLKIVLQEMSRSERLVAISSMPVQTRLRLASFMESPAEPCIRSNNSKPVHARGGLSSPSFLKPGRGVWVVNGKQCTRYKARVNFNSLCLYGQWQANAETAIEHQIALVRIRNAAMPALLENSKLQHDPDWFSQLCRSILAECEVRASDIGLSAYVTVRGFGCRVESPSLSVGQAWALRARLVGSRENSWAAFRGEWVRLLCNGRKRVSRSQAEQIVEDNHQTVLRQQFSRALTVANRLVNLQRKGSR